MHDGRAAVKVISDGIPTYLPCTYVGINFLD